MEKRTTERYVGGESFEMERKKREEGVCVSTPSSSWRFVHKFPQSSKFDHKQNLMYPNVSARKLAAHLYRDSFSVCNQAPYHASTYQVPQTVTEGAGGGLMTEAAAPSVQLPQVLRGRNHFQRSTTSGTDISSAEAASSDSTNLRNTRIQGRDYTLGLGTSAEMVSVLNMRNLENQQISSGSHLKALNGMLHDSQRRIRDLRGYDQNEQQKVEVIVEKILKGRVRKSLSSTILALKSELDDEQRRRKQLESRNRKLEKEIGEVRLSFSSNLKMLEKERISCKMVEDLCDKFAKAILDGKSEVSSAKQRRLKEDESICRMAEAWLNERTQPPNRFRKKIVSGKMKSEIQAFLEAKLSLGLKTKAESDEEEMPFYRRSSESFLLNDPGNQIPAHEENSTENESSCVEQPKWVTSRKSTGSSTGTGKCSAINSHLIVNNLKRRYSLDIGEHKTQTCDIKAIAKDSCSQMQQLHLKLTTSPVNPKQQSLAWKSKEGSLGSHLLEARKRPQYCTASSGVSKSRVCRLSHEKH